MGKIIGIVVLVIFSAYFSAFLFGFVGREAAVCTAGKSPETRINKGFAMVLYF